MSTTTPAQLSYDVGTLTSNIWQARVWHNT